MPRVKQFNEKEILNKAKELFWEKGFHATSIQDLVCHLGINRASLYDTFGGKEELFSKAFEQYRNEAGNFLRITLDQESSVRLGLERLFDIVIEGVMADESRKGCFVVNATTELIPGDEALRQVIRNNNLDVQRIFIEYIQKGIDKGELSAATDANGIGLMLFAFYSGLQVVAKVDSDPKKLKDMVKASLSVLD